MLGPGQAQARALPARLDLRGLRRPAGPPAARELLGPRQPDRPARRLRRGQALRRGADDGLPPPAGRRHRDRAHLQHLRPADAPARRPRDPDLPAPGARRTSRSPCSATARQTRSFCYVDDLIRGLVALAESDEHLPGQHRQPGRVHAAGAGRDGHRGDRLDARRSSSRRCRSTTRRCASPTSRAPASCSAGSRRSSSATACGGRSSRPGVERLVGATRELSAPWNRLRIAHLTATFPPYPGGAGNTATASPAGQAERGHHVEVFTRPPRATPPDPGRARSSTGSSPVWRSATPR